MTLALFQFFVALAGLTVFALVEKSSKAQQIGLALFTAGMICVLLLLDGPTHRF